MLHGARDRRLARAAAEAQREADAALEALPPLPAAGDGPEAHIMCGERQFVMGAWSSYSLLRFIPEARLVVHTDGSLTEQTLARWRRIAPGMRVVSREEGLAAMRRRLRPFPRILDWCERYHFGIKLGGTHSIAEAQRVLEFDSDTLALREPRALLDALRDSSVPLTWNADIAYCYAYPEATLRDALGDMLGPLPWRLNGGLMAGRRLDDADWALLDAALGRFGERAGIDPMRFWMHQTLIAVLASHMGDKARPLPREYDIHDGPTRPDASMRHYVGHPGIRPRFFIEGVPFVRDAVEPM
ncbi:hypothetical protein [Rubrimonas cliftonensis]|uniref:hypothetical protein n=1 Tax=Rubrimonas cliftonensis TaxID=89524 RepID=UPI000B809CA7|nr:hypothetical protein [Rubrimonas cliftonensis]